MRNRVVWPALWGAVFGVLLAVPLFFLVFRLAVFNTVPRDDYAPFLLWLAGAQGGAFPSSPYCYRVLSMVVAWPLYEVMPRAALTNIPGSLSPEWVRATAAISAETALCLVAACFVTVAVARRCGLGLAEAALAGLLLVVLSLYTQIASIDAVALLLIALGPLLVRCVPAFAVLILVSIPADEKVALVLALWLGVRVVLVPEDRGWAWWPFVAAAAGVLLYVAMVKILAYPGNDYQLRAAAFLDTILENLRAYASMRGVLLNILPAALLLALAWFGQRQSRTAPLFRGVDALVIMAMLLVALVVTHLFQAGRLAMHAAPLFVVPVAAALQTRTQAKDGRAL
jgi:hypothetical protein